MTFKRFLHFLSQTDRVQEYCIRGFFQEENLFLQSGKANARFQNVRTSCEVVFGCTTIAHYTKPL